MPSRLPTVQPTLQPVSPPSFQPTMQPTCLPRRFPSSQPLRFPTQQPTFQPVKYPSYIPSSQPSFQPSFQPFLKPTIQPSSQPSRQPSLIPSVIPSRQPERVPTSQPFRFPSVQPTELPSQKPTYQPLVHPTMQPFVPPSTKPTKIPSCQPTHSPSFQPTRQPTRQPSLLPTLQPKRRPTVQPSKIPTHTPSFQPSRLPTKQPTKQPVQLPSNQPSKIPSGQPTEQPSKIPTKQPLFCPTPCKPSNQPTLQPLDNPSYLPTNQPTSLPSQKPSIQPSVRPTFQPIQKPTSQPSYIPSEQPTEIPSYQPVKIPSTQPIARPTRQPTFQPSRQPLRRPSTQPRRCPTSQPTRIPFRVPTKQPLHFQPTLQPLRAPSSKPSLQPSITPSLKPTNQPSTNPSSFPSSQPFSTPTSQPSQKPINSPSFQPSHFPSKQPIMLLPTKQPSMIPTKQPFHLPTIQPLPCPTSQPSRQPVKFPTYQPTKQPSKQPIRRPSKQPTFSPSIQPFVQPTRFPSYQPTSCPSHQPTKSPSRHPSRQPSRQPSRIPSSMPSRCPSSQPTTTPTKVPSPMPTLMPIGSPSIQPTSQPSVQPSKQPNQRPSSQPTHIPTAQPIRQPSSTPTHQPRIRPSVQPSEQPLNIPTAQPTRFPSRQPSKQPLKVPTFQPTQQPYRYPSWQPTQFPSRFPSSYPSTQPTMEPSTNPSASPTKFPSVQPLRRPSNQPTKQPLRRPTRQPSLQPTMHPTQQQPVGLMPSYQPSKQPNADPTSKPTSQEVVLPSSKPSCQPKVFPTAQPTLLPIRLPSTQPSREPSCQPSRTPRKSPSNQPSCSPSNKPSENPSLQPRSKPTKVPKSYPTDMPSRQPARLPSRQPTRQPLRRPSLQPRSRPTLLPSSQPVICPSARPSLIPTLQVTTDPSMQPSRQPIYYPTSQPNRRPSRNPSKQPGRCPTTQPTTQPKRYPTLQPTNQPARRPSTQPARFPSTQPSLQPKRNPSSQPKKSPSQQPSIFPTSQPTNLPSCKPTKQPKLFPSTLPTLQPFNSPSVFPTLNPSTQPSKLPRNRPTLQPVKVPSRQPMRKPSSQPSRKPTLQITSRPTTQPSKQPSCQPLRNPSKQPLGVPSTQPKRRPTKQPATSPSSQPTTTPTSPTSQPSKHPTMQPTKQPSKQPTRQPTLQPSTIPSCQPFMKPSNIPTLQPVYEPSALPTLQPTNSPSLQPVDAPSMQPSRRPSCQPSAQPRFKPSIRPTRQPFRRPSSQPSLQPTGRPTSSRPSSRPSGTPTKLPTTFVPTLTKNRVVIPKGQPTSVPSYNLNYLTSPHYRDYKSLTSAVQNFTNAYSYYSFNYKTLAVRGSCTDWNSFLRNQLSAPFDYFIYTDLNATFVNHDYRSHTTTTSKFTCSSESVVLKLVSALRGGLTLDVNCNGNLWRIFSCSGVSVLCINCKRSCAPSVLCPAKSSSFGACATGCDGRVAATTVLTAGYLINEFYPLIVSFNSTASQLSISAAVKISSPGTVTCAAFKSPYTPTSLQLIYQNGYAFNGMIPGAVVNMAILNLEPSSTYDIYCTTSDYAGHSMTLADTILNHMTVTTLCCKSVVTLTKVAAIIQSSATSIYNSLSGNVPQFYFGLNARPTKDVTLAFAIRTCTGAAGSPDVRVYPSTYIFRPTASSLSSGFLVKGTTIGCYTLKAFVQNSPEIYAAANLTFIIQNYKTSLPPPKLQGASLTNDGLFLNVFFDSPTSASTIVSNNQSTLRSSPVNCSSLVKFPGSGYATCSWVTSSQLVAYLPGYKVGPILPSVGDYVQLQPNTIKAQCLQASVTDCLNYLYSPVASTSISAPKTPISPVVSLFGPTSISSCDDLVVDPTASTGKASRNWYSLTWNVSGSASANQITSYLNANYKDITALVTVPINLFLPGYEYTLRLVLTNFFRRSSAGSISFTVNGIGNLVPAPLVRMYTPTQSYYRWQEIDIFAAVSFSKCGSLSNSGNSSLLYTWKVYQGATYMAKFQSASVDARFFTIPPFVLSPSTVYTVSVVVSLYRLGDSSRILSSSVASVDIAMGSAGLVAKIKGGTSWTVGTTGTVILDASESYDMDYPDQSLQYLWSCMSVSPVYGGSCKMPSTGQSNALMSFAASLLDSQQEYNFTVSVYSASGKRAVASVLINVISASVPQISLFATPSASKYNTKDSLVLTGNISSSGQISTAYWSCIDLSTSSFLKAVSTPVSGTFLPGDSAFQLSYSLQYLQPGLTYDFTLTANYLNSKTASSATISININKPPIGGSIRMNPITGIAFDTQFYFSTAGWIDDASDLPFSYQFAYTVLDSGEANIVKSFNAVPYVFSTIGQGLASQQNVVKCLVTVSDTNSGQSSSSTSVTVAPTLLSPGLVLQTQNAFTKAFSAKNSDAVLQTVNSVLGSANSVDCQVTTPCATLQRQPCMSTTRTCGPCLSGTIGFQGDSNTMCQVPGKFNHSGESCLKNSDCATGLCSSFVCVDTSKRCPNNCNGKGVCVFKSDVGLVIPACNVSNSYCTASCSCQTGYFGSDCSLIDASYKQELSLRSSLCMNIRNSLSVQASTADVIQQRATAIASIFTDGTQISAGALQNCSAALIETVYRNTRGSCQGNNQYLITKAFSKVVQSSGYVIPRPLFLNITNTVAYLAGVCLRQMAVNQRPSVIVTDNIRLISFKVQRALGSSSQVCVSTQSDYEKALNTPTTSFCLNVSSLSSPSQVLGVTIQGFVNNPTLRNSPSSGLTIGTFTNTPTAVRRKKARVLGQQDNLVDALITFQSKSPLNYAQVNQSTIIVECTTKSMYPYKEAGVCPNGFAYNVTCPAGQRGYYEVRCTGFVTMPRCTFWDGDSYISSPYCTVDSYDQYGTTCLCRQTATTRTQSLSADTATIYAYQSETFHSYTTPETNVLGNVVISTVSCVTGLLIVGILCFIVFDNISVSYKNSDGKLTELNSPKDRSLRSRTIKGFFDKLISADLRSKKWYNIFGRRLVLDHSLIRLLSSPWTVNDLENFPVHWIIVLGRVLIIFTIETVMSMYFNADDGFCQEIKSVSSCNANAATVAKFAFPYRHCAWNVRSHSCDFQGLDINSFVVFILWTFSVLFFGIPFFRLLDTLAWQAKWALTPSERMKVIPIEQASDGPIVGSDEFLSSQRFKSTMLRAAGLILSQKYIDYVAVEDEADHIFELGHEDEERSKSNTMANNMDVTSFKNIRYGFNLFTTSKNEIVQKVTSAKDTCEKIALKLDGHLSSSAKEDYLMRVFLVESFSGSVRHVVKKFLFPFSPENAPLSSSSMFVVVSVVLLVVGFVGMSYFIVRFGLTVGSKSAMLWLITGFTCVGEDNFLVQPLKIYLNWVAITSYFRTELNFIVDRLVQRSKLILMRTSGVLRSYKWLVQHMNPACRVARLNPICALPVARLIMAINDYDLPREPVRKAWLWPLSSVLRATITILLLLPKAYLPNFIADILLNLVAIVLINGFAVGLYFVSIYTGHYIYPIIIVVGLLLVLVMYELFMTRATTFFGSRLRSAKTDTTKIDKDSKDSKLFDSIEEIDNEVVEQDDDDWDEVGSLSMSQFGAKRFNSERPLDDDSTSQQEPPIVVSLEEKQPEDEKEMSQKFPAAPKLKPSVLVSVKATEIVTTRTGGALEEDSIISAGDQLSASHRMKPYLLPMNSRFTKPYQQQKEQQQHTTYSLLDLVPPSTSARDARDTDRSEKYRASSARNRRTIDQEIDLGSSDLLDDIILSSPAKGSTQQEDLLESPNKLESYLDLSAVMQGSTYTDTGNAFAMVQPVPSKGDNVNDSHVENEVSVSVDNAIVEYGSSSMKWDGSRSATVVNNNSFMSSGTYYYDPAQQHQQHQQQPTQNFEDSESIASNAERYRSPYQMMRKRSRKKSRGGGDDDHSRNSRKAREKDSDRNASSARTATAGDGDGSVTRSVSSYQRNSSRHRRSVSRNRSNDSAVPETGNLTGRKNDGPGVQSIRGDHEPMAGSVGIADGGSVDRGRQALSKKMTLVDLDESQADPIVVPPFFEKESPRSADSQSQNSSRVGPGSKLYNY
eukprot:gene24036-32447_t